MVVLILSRSHDLRMDSEQSFTVTLPLQKKVPGLKVLLLVLKVLTFVLGPFSYFFSLFKKIF